MKKKILAGLLVLSIVLGEFGFGTVSDAAAMKLNKKRLTLKVGKSYKLKVKKLKGKKVKWKTSNKKVAKVNKKGKVTAKKKGKAVIRAIVGKKKLKCKVNVIANKKPVQTYAPVTNQPIQPGNTIVNPPVNNNTPAPVVNDDSFVQISGDVDKTYADRVKAAFSEVIKEMQTDGIIASNATCITMDKTTINVDITPSNSTTDLVLSTDDSTGVYTLALDKEFVWLDGLSTLINGKDPAKYNKKLLLSLLSIISDQSQTVFDTIDQTYFSSYSLSTTEWTQVGDVYMIDGADSVEGAFSYKIRKELEVQGPTLPPESADNPSEQPTNEPTAKPTATPTTKPTVKPTAKPTTKPTQKPTATPTVKPTAVPTTLPDNNVWVTTWGTAEEKCDITASAMPQMNLEGTTVRQIIRATTSGNKIKLRLSNQYGQSDVNINSLHIAKQSKSAYSDGTGTASVDLSTIIKSTDTVITVGGKESFAIPKGKVIETDAIDFSVDALDNLAISMYFGKTPTNNITGHRGARATTYQVSGNKTSDEVLSSYKTTTSWFFLADVSLMQPEGSRAVVCFGDSITDGYGTDAGYLGKKPDSYTRWVDYFAKRLQADADTKNVAVINEGIGSNSMMGSYPTDAGKDRFERDLLEHDSVAYCIVLFGVNDLDKLPNTSKFNQLKPEYEKMVKLAHENGIKIYAAPILPFGTSSYYNENSEAVRTMINNWMRSDESGFDGIIDFESALADPDNPKNLLYEYTLGDGLHPYEGYDVMANAIDLSLFGGKWTPMPTRTPTPTATPMPDMDFEFEEVKNAIPFDISKYENVSGGGSYNTETGRVEINDSSSSALSQGAWALPAAMPLINIGDMVTFRIQGYNYGTSGFRFWIGNKNSGSCTPILLNNKIDENLAVGEYPCIVNGQTKNQMKLVVDEKTGAFDVTFTFKAGTSQNDTDGIFSHLTLKYIMGGDTSGYIDGLCIKNIYYIPENADTDETEKPVVPTATPTTAPTASPTVAPTAEPGPTPPPEMKDEPSAPYQVKFGSDTIVTQGEASYVINDDGTVTISVARQYSGIGFMVPDSVTEDNFNTVTIKYKNPVNVGDGFGNSLFRYKGDTSTETVLAWGGVFSSTQTDEYTVTLAGRNDTKTWYANYCLFFNNTGTLSSTNQAQVTIESVTFSHSEYVEKYTTELFSVEIDEKAVESVEGNTVTVDMQYFTGDITGEYFNGSVLSESSNVTKTYKDGKVTNCAKFIMSGTDDKGEECKIFIQDEGIKEEGVFYTSPVIITDSSSLRWMETADIQGQVMTDANGKKTVTYYWNEASTVKKEPPVIKRPDMTKNYDTELFRFFINIGESDAVESSDRSMSMIHFTGSGEFENFNGEVVRESVDTRLNFPGQVQSLSARYILEGTDKNGNPCRIYVENNGIDDNGMVTEPTIITDCPEYAWIEKAPLHGTVSWDAGLTIHVWTTADAVPGVEKEVELSSANEYANIECENVTYSNGEVTFDAKPNYGGGGMAYWIAGNGNLFDISEYGKIQVEISSESTNVPMQFGLYKNINKNIWDNYIPLGNNGFRTSQNAGEKTIVEYNLDNIEGIDRDGSAYGLGIRMAWNSSEKCKITIHSIKFIPAEPIPELVSLKSLAAPVFGEFGTCINYSQLKQLRTIQYLQKHYTSISLENEMKPDALLGNGTLITTEEAKKDTAKYVIPDSYKEANVPKFNFDTIDNVLKLCKEYGLKLRAHTLVWHSQTPEFFFREGYDKNGAYVSEETMNARLEMFIRSVMNHVYTLDNGAYKDVVYTWDVANEYMHNNEDANWSAVYGNRATVLKNKPGYIKYAFQIAYDCLEQFDLDGKVTLVYNDFNTYWDCRDNIIEMINYINAEKKICDGVGMQSHLGVKFPSVSSYLQTVEAFLDAGFEVQITELDIGVDPKDATQTLEMQAEYVRQMTTGLIDIQERKGGITGMTWWGLCDQVSWRGANSSEGNSHPLLFDKTMYDTKPAYDSFMNSFK